LEGCTDLSLVEATIDRVVKSGSEYLEAPEACEAIAAIETVARLQGNWGKRSSYSEPVDNWVEAHQLKPSSTLAIKAHQALDRIVAEQSELCELWKDSEHFEEWRSSVQELRGRVNA
jgi:hypothetical protein